MRHARKRVRTGFGSHDAFKGKLSGAGEGMLHLAEQLVVGQHLIDRKKGELSAAKADIMSLENDMARLERTNLEIRDGISTSTTNTWIWRRNPTSFATGGK